MKFFIPGKTFLLGEYLVLSQGPSLIFTNRPYFSLEVCPSQSTKISGIHPDSPTGKFIHSNQKTFENYEINFQSPYTLGGLGASSAQFLSVFQAYCELYHIPFRTSQLLETYWQFAYPGFGVKPSGADLIAQASCGICYYHANEKILQTLAWPFEDLSLLIFHTNNKLATHEHLESLSNRKWHELKEHALFAMDAFQTKQADLFCKQIQSYGETLDKLNLVSLNTKVLLKRISQLDGVCAAKGCGAMGADTIAVFCEPREEKSLRKTITEKLGLSFLANQKHLCHPLNTEVEELAG